MSYAIGCIGTGVDLRTKTKAAMTKAQRVKNNKLVPRKVRNQTRDIAFIEVMHDEGYFPTVRAIKKGQLGHYEKAFFYGKVRYLKNPDGTVLTIKHKK